MVALTEKSSRRIAEMLQLYRDGDIIKSTAFDLEVVGFIRTLNGTAVATDGPKVKSRPEKLSERFPNRKWNQGAVTLDQGCTWREWFTNDQIDKFIELYAQQTIFTPKDVYDILCKALPQEGKAFWLDRKAIGWFHNTNIHTVFGDEVGSQLDAYQKTTEFTAKNVFDILRQVLKLDEC